MDFDRKWVQTNQHRMHMRSESLLRNRPNKSRHIFHEVRNVLQHKHRQYNWFQKNHGYYTQAWSPQSQYPLLHDLEHLLSQEFKLIKGFCFVLQFTAGMFGYELLHAPRPHADGDKYPNHSLPAHTKRRSCWDETYFLVQALPWTVKYIRSAVQRFPKTVSENPITQLAGTFPCWPSINDMRYSIWSLLLLLMAGITGNAYPCLEGVANA